MHTICMAWGSRKRSRKLANNSMLKPMESNRPKCLFSQQSRWRHQRRIRSSCFFFIPDLYQRLGLYSRLNCMSAEKFTSPPAFTFSIVSRPICQWSGFGPLFPVVSVNRMDGKKETWRNCRWVKYMICKGTMSEASSFYMIARISLLNDSSISRPAYVCAVIWYSSRRKSKHERPLSLRPHDSELRDITSGNLKNSDLALLFGLSKI